MDKRANAAALIELSTVYFCKGPVPSVLALNDCGLQIEGAAPGAFAALYGTQSKQEGFVAACDFAERNRLQFTVIDLLIALDYRIHPGLMKEDEFAQHDFVAFQRLARSGSDRIKEILLSSPTLDAHAGAALHAGKPAAVLLERPDLLGSIVNHPSLQHVKVVAHHARPLFSERALAVATVPLRHWGAVVEVTCRLNPSTRVIHEAPVGTEGIAPIAPKLGYRTQARPHRKP